MDKMQSSYKEEDVVLLLKDITGLVRPQPTEEREKLIQAGRHYCEMLPMEYVPSQQYMEAYQQALIHFAKPTAAAIGRLAELLVQEKGDSLVLISLARAGIPIGILLKHYIKTRFNIDAPHYSISIIRGRGIDGQAMRYLLSRYEPQTLQFVDGWIGKGAIWRELKKAAGAYPGVSPEIAVAADPANITRLCGTHEDLLIPSACLNCTVSGLISRTFLREDIIGEGDFHGAAYYEELEAADLSYAFIHAVEAEFPMVVPHETYMAGGIGMDDVQKIKSEFDISDINFIKPGIGEATRVLLRRLPWKILIDPRHKEDAALAHLLRLAEEKHVPTAFYPMRHYKACGIIKKLADA